MPSLKPSAPQQLEALLHLAQSQRELEQWGAAQKSFKKLLKLAPKHSTASLELAQIYLQQRKTAKARKVLENALAQDPHEPRCLLLWSEQFGHDQAETTLKHLETALQAHPENAELHLALASYLKDQPDSERFAFYLQQCRRMDVSSGEYWLKLAPLLLQAGELAQAAESFQKAAELAPELRQDPNWLDLDAEWQKLEASIQDINLAEWELRQTDFAQRGQAEN